MKFSVELYRLERTSTGKNSTTLEQIEEEEVKLQ